jgi:hypothetical protein
MPCGPDVGRWVELLKPFAEAGFTDVALIQVGGDRQQEFLDWAGKELLPVLRREL